MKAFPYAGDLFHILYIEKNTNIWNIIKYNKNRSLNVTMVVIWLLE